MKLIFLKLVSFTTPCVSTGQTVHRRAKQAKMSKDHFRKAALVTKTKFWDLKTFGVPLQG